MGRQIPHIQKNTKEMTQYKFKINGKEYEVTVNSVEGGNASVSVNGTEYNVELENAPAAAQPSAPAAAPANIPASSAAAAQAAPAPAAAPAPSGAGKKITSPLPGVIIDVCVKEGDTVKRGQKIAVIEAMKMENDILAESDGTVSAIYVKKSDSVLEGADIASIA